MGKPQCCNPQQCAHIANRHYRHCLDWSLGLEEKDVNTHIEVKNCVSFSGTLSNISRNFFSKSSQLVARMSVGSFYSIITAHFIIRFLQGLVGIIQYDFSD